MTTRVAYEVREADVTAETGRQADPGPFLAEDAIAPAEFILRRVDDGRFMLCERFRYISPDGVTYLIPDQLTEFRSDLASVPTIFTWLVPRDGTHTPAALLHDALITGRYVGPPVSRERADALFRAATEALGVPVIRRWLLWGAVRLAGLWDRPGVARVYWRVLIVLSIAAFLALGAAQAVDLVDAYPSWGLPWMGDRPWWLELVAALGVTAGATAVTLPLWGRHWRVGLILGPTFTTLAPSVLLVALTLAGYYALEMVVSRLVEGRGPRIDRGRGV